MKRAANPPLYTLTSSTKYQQKLQEIVNKLDKEILRIKTRSLRGLISAHKVIHDDMDRTPPLVPRDTGNLKASYFMVTSKGATITGKTPHFENTNHDADRMDSDHSRLVTICANKAMARDEKVGPNIIFGYSAYYGPYVHENVTAKEWTREGSGPHWFQAAIRRNSRKVLSIIRQEAKKHA